jgi:heme O synthase-like polyprenyltransferase
MYSNFNINIGGFARCLPKLVGYKSRRDAINKIVAS